MIEIYEDEIKQTLDKIKDIELRERVKFIINNLRRQNM